MCSLSDDGAMSLQRLSEAEQSFVCRLMQLCLNNDCLRPSSFWFVG